MGFWSFGGGKKQDGFQPSQARPDNRSQLEKVRTDAYPATGPSSNAKRDWSGTKSRSRTVSIPQPLRSQTAPVLTESKSVQNIRSAFHQRGKEFYQHVPASQTDLDAENLPAFSGPPTLFAKRPHTGAQSPRPKSRRKADDSAREREIKAMSSAPIPIPKPTPNYRSGSPLVRETRQISGPFKRHSSEVSLPLPGTLAHVDFTSSQNSFKVGLLASLSPRPNLQYDSQARTPSGKQPVRAGLAIQKAIEEEDVSDLKRIDELADDLDAGGLRELMERDRKRRDKKKEVDRERMLRRLERRALKDREEETRRARTEAYVRESSPANPERRRGRKGESSGSRSARTTKKTTRPVKDATKDADSDRWTETRKAGTEATKPPSTNTTGATGAAAPAPIRNPFMDESDSDTPAEVQAATRETADLDVPMRSPLRPVGKTLEPGSTPAKPTEPPVAPVAQPNRRRSSLSRASASILSRSGRSEKIEEAEHQRNTSNSTNMRLSTWTNFFSTGTRRKLAGPPHGTQPPPEFSAPSREVDQRKPSLPPVVTDRTFRQASFGAPQRTLSKFREDLPDFPVVHDESGVQSPVSPVSPMSATSPVRIMDVSQQRILDLDHNISADSIQRSLNLDPQPPYPTNTPLPLSMASVDSEGSWLSNRPSKRVSNASRPASMAQRTQRSPSPDALSPEDSRTVGDAGGEARSSPSLGHDERGMLAAPHVDHHAEAPELPPKSERRNTNATDAGQPSTQADHPKTSDDSSGINSDHEKTTPSRDEAGDHDDVESPGSVEIVDAPILRAQSVEYRGHARAVSAGSAKLLDIRRISTHSDLGRPRSPTLARKSTLGAGQPDDAGPGTPATLD